ncbi:GNAT family N-acetyltransferase [Rhizobium sp. BK068]|uniref:GNAT family N-acetyltransferase n=1 Tax=Rhizobium sp. BK068 TaxID=2512130 RepID=UPI00104D8463|nr:GNAT family N-acetyltransferase [Rhizobium sp. BK068]TCM75310.1 GNAT family acetyltransferase [Rhizobium sp. BK068]
MESRLIRILGIDDVAIFQRIRLEALRLEPAAFASSAEDWEALTDEEWRKRLIDGPVFVAFRHDDPVGIMGLSRQRASKMAHRATLIMVYVRRCERGGGCAKSLLDATVGYARGNGIRQLELAVSAENIAAIRFYEREGFHETGRIPGGFMHDNREIDDVIMVRRIED